MDKLIFSSVLVAYLKVQKRLIGRGLPSSSSLVMNENMCMTTLLNPQEGGVTIGILETT
jgi:hypothetical protein